VDSYRTEDEQVEALRRWWDENGRSTIVAVAIALAAGFGWQGWQANRQATAEAASETYQSMLQILSAEGGEPAQAIDIAERLKEEFRDTTYAQFAALHLAAMAVEREDLADAEAQLRWVLGRADKGSDTARVAQLRLARVVAARGDTERALAILAEGGGETYAGSTAMARGDILFAAGRTDEAKDAYLSAQVLLAAGGQGAVNLPTLQAKMQRLSPVPPGEPSADEEPSASEEPSANNESSADGAPDTGAAASAGAEPAAPTPAASGD